MITKVLNYRFTQLSLSLLIILGMITCIFTPNYFLFKQGAQFAFQIMLGYLFIGLVFLVFKQPRLMFTSFTCCAVLCLYLKYSTNSTIAAHPQKTSETVIDIAHFDVSATNEDYETTIQRMLSVNADLISVQEVNPDWAPKLEEALSAYYPYHKTIVQLEYGLAVYSRVPIIEIDTFTCGDAPNIIGTLKMNSSNEKVCFITSNAPPAFYSTDFEKLRNHLMTIAQYSNHQDCPVITIGDYNVVPWSYEIQDFRAAANLSDSRRGFMPTSNGEFSLFQIPSDHIFHSDDFQCLGFDDINSPFSGGHIGIRGSYQLKSDYVNVQKTNS